MNARIQDLLITRRNDDTGLLPMVSPTTQIAANQTGGVGSVAIGFSFRFGGVAGNGYSSCYLGAGGLIRLAGSFTTHTLAQLYAAAANAGLGPWLGTTRTAIGDGYVRTETQGSAPWRRFVVEWRVYLASGQTTINHDVVVFQAVLYETTGRIEYRYGPRTRTGSPGTSSSHAVCLKGAHVSETTHRRNLWDNDLVLGGSQSSTTANLNHGHYDQLVIQGTFVIEPNWPMSDRFFAFSADELAGLQSPYGEPIWKLVNNYHWLICNHQPSLVALAPFQPAVSTSMTLVVPEVVPDTDCSYECWVTCYLSDGGDVTVSVDSEDAADPQPEDGADWQVLAADTQPRSSGWQTLALTLTFPDNTPRALRVYCDVDTGTVIVSAVVLRPQRRTWFAADAITSCIPVGLGQIRQRGGAVHPEIYNRLYRGVARLLAARRQMLWSWSMGPTVKGVPATGYVNYPQTLLCLAPSAIPGWLQQLARISIYAKASADGRSWSVGERGGDSIRFPVDSNGGEYRADGANLQLRSDEPILQSVVTPGTSGTMDPMTAVATWAPQLADVDLLVGTTPSPSLAALVGLASRLTRAVQAVAMTGYATQLWLAGNQATKTRLLWNVPPGVSRLWPKVIRVANGVNLTARPTNIQAASSGSSSAEMIIMPAPHGTGNELHPPRGVEPVLVVSGQSTETLPSVAMDRLMLSPTDDPAWLGSELEEVQVSGGFGMTLVPRFNRAPE